MLRDRPEAFDRMNAIDRAPIESCLSCQSCRNRQVATLERCLGPEAAIPPRRTGDEADFGHVQPPEPRAERQADSEKRYTPDEAEARSGMEYTEDTSVYTNNGALLP